jgi:uncharacterized cupredoxin-like copper-binding protein
MAKYTLGSLAGFVIIATIAFLALARINERAEALPTTTVTIVVADSGVTPRDIDVNVGQPLQITLASRVATVLSYLDLDSENVEQLTNVQAARPDKLVPAFHIEAKPGTSSSATARFKEPGDYELQETSPGLQGAHIITVHVK